MTPRKPPAGEPKPPAESRPESSTPEGLSVPDWLVNLVGGLTIQNSAYEQTIRALQQQSPKEQ